MRQNLKGTTEINMSKGSEIKQLGNNPFWVYISIRQIKHNKACIHCYLMNHALIIHKFSVIYFKHIILKEILMWIVSSASFLVLYWLLQFLNLLCEVNVCMPQCTCIGQRTAL